MLARSIYLENTLVVEIFEKMSQIKQFRFLLGNSKSTALL